VPRKTPFAIDADGAKGQSVAGDIDFTNDAFAQPAFLFVRANACNVLHFSDKFMSRSAAKIVVAAQDFDVGVADAGETNADKRPAAPQIGNGLAGGEKLVVADDEGEQGNLLFGFFRKRAPRGRRHSLEQFKFCLDPNQSAVEFAESRGKAIDLGAEALHAVLKQDDLADRCVGASGPAHCGPCGIASVSDRHERSFRRAV